MPSPRAPPARSCAASYENANSSRLLERCWCCFFRRRKKQQLNRDEDHRPGEPRELRSMGRSAPCAATGGSWVPRKAQHSLSVPRVAASVRLDSGKETEKKETETFGGMRNVVSRWLADSVSGHGA